MKLTVLLLALTLTAPRPAAWENARPWKNESTSPKPSLSASGATSAAGSFDGRSSASNATARTRSATRPSVLGATSAAAADRLTGRASWYAVDGYVAAAGPRLRNWLGKGWRGTRVLVSSGNHSVVVQLVDWCQCYRGERRERVIDLSDSAFRELAPLPVGVLRVTIEAVVPPETDALS